MSIELRYAECPKCRSPLQATIDFFIELGKKLVWTESDDFPHYRCINPNCRWNNPR